MINGSVTDHSRIVELEARCRELEQAYGALMKKQDDVAACAMNALAELRDAPSGRRQLRLVSSQ
jgi:hypothetical protein